MSKNTQLIDDMLHYANFLKYILNRRFLLISVENFVLANNRQQIAGAKAVFKKLGRAVAHNAAFDHDANAIAKLVGFFDVVRCEQNCSKRNSQLCTWKLFAK